MNDQEIDKFIQNLPPQIKTVINDNTWRNRTLEIAKKYSLSSEQSDNLTDAVALMLIGLQHPAAFMETAPAELNLSKLLIGQIMDELNTRVFDYALKLIDDFESKKLKIEIKPAQQTTKIEIKKPPMIPEIAPEILPEVLKNQKVKINPPPKPEVRKGLAEAIASATKPQPQKPAQQIKPSEIKPEPIQRPVPVPKFTAAKIEETKPVTIQNPKPNPTVQVKPPEAKIESKPQPVKIIDPYREPIE